MLRVKIAVPKQAFVQKKIKKTQDTIITSMNEIADSAASFMSAYIIAHTKRHPSSGKLAKAIRKAVRVDKNTYSVGVGEKSKLPSYWYVVNYGKLFGGGAYTPPTTGGYFSQSIVPMRGGMGERFIAKSNTFLMTPKKPIEPMRYIEATKAYIKDRWKSRVVKRFRG